MSVSVSAWVQRYQDNMAAADVTTGSISSTVVQICENLDAFNEKLGNQFGEVTDVIVDMSSKIAEHAEQHRDDIQKIADKVAELAGEDEEVTEV